MASRMEWSHDQYCRQAGLWLGGRHPGETQAGFLVRNKKVLLNPHKIQIS